MASSAWYAQGVVGLVSATAARRFDWVNDTITVSLHTASYTPDQDIHDFFNDVTNELSNGVGGVSSYSRQTLSGKSINYDSATNTVQLRASDTVFSAFTAPEFRYAVMWIDTGGASSTDPLLGFVDLGSQSISASPFTINWNDTAGVLSMAVA